MIASGLMSGPIAMLTGAPTLLAWRPFLDPIDVHDAWWLTLIPLALGMSIAYKAVRMKTLDRFWRQVFMMTVQIVLAMIALSIAIFLLVEIVVPFFD